jgi:hypothetical protein
MMPLASPMLVDSGPMSTRRDIDLTSQTRDHGNRSRRTAVVIGIDRYEAWPWLSNAVRDALGAADLFAGLGFEQCWNVRLPGQLRATCSRGRPGAVGARPRARRSSDPASRRRCERDRPKRNEFLFEHLAASLTTFRPWWRAYHDRWQSQYTRARVVGGETSAKYRAVGSALVVDEG